MFFLILLMNFILSFISIIMIDKKIKITSILFSILFFAIISLLIFILQIIICYQLEFINQNIIVYEETLVYYYGRNYYYIISAYILYSIISNAIKLYRENSLKKIATNEWTSIVGDLTRYIKAVDKRYFVAAQLVFLLTVIISYLLGLNGYESIDSSVFIIFSLNLITYIIFTSFIFTSFTHYRFFLFIAPIIFCIYIIVFHYFVRALESIFGFSFFGINLTALALSNVWLPTLAFLIFCLLAISYKLLNQSIK